MRAAGALARRYRRRRRRRRRETRESSRVAFLPSSPRPKPRASAPALAHAASAGAPLSNTNFAKMMSMQQEINQLKAHIEGLNAGAARQRRQAGAR